MSASTLMRPTSERAATTLVLLRADFEAILRTLLLNPGTFAVAGVRPPAGRPSHGNFSPARGGIIATCRGEIRARRWTTGSCNQSPRPAA
ncbi:MAG: hypothetical protein U0992_21760 [Planctomycetaceae bacterium]